VEREVKIAPVINGSLGTIKKGLDQKLQFFPGKLSAIELPKFTLISTANIIYRVPEKNGLISC
jgi:hypothetical protein